MAAQAPYSVRYDLGCCACGLRADSDRNARKCTPQDQCQAACCDRLSTPAGQLIHSRCRKIVDDRHCLLAASEPQVNPHGMYPSGACPEDPEPAAEQLSATATATAAAAEEHRQALQLPQSKPQHPRDKQAQHTQPRSPRLLAQKPVHSSHLTLLPVQQHISRAMH